MIKRLFRAFALLGLVFTGLLWAERAVAEAAVAESDLERIRLHVAPFWALPSPGDRDVSTGTIRIRISLQEDGSLLSAHLEDLPKEADAFWEAAAQSALRAIVRASPLPIPRDRADQFRDFTMTFHLVNIR